MWFKATFNCLGDNGGLASGGHEWIVLIRGTKATPPERKMRERKAVRYAGSETERRERRACEQHTTNTWSRERWRATTTTLSGKAGSETVLPAPETSGRARPCWSCRHGGGEGWDQAGAQTLERPFGASERRHPKALQIDNSGAVERLRDWPCWSCPAPRSRPARGFGRISRAEAALHWGVCSGQPSARRCDRCRAVNGRAR